MSTSQLRNNPNAMLSHDPKPPSQSIVASIDDIRAMCTTALSSIKKLLLQSLLSSNIRQPPHYHLKMSFDSGIGIMRLRPRPMRLVQLYAAPYAVDKSCEDEQLL
jgi:hypothetical protein